MSSFSNNCLAVGVILLLLSVLLAMSGNSAVVGLAILAGSIGGVALCLSVIFAAFNRFYELIRTDLINEVRRISEAVESIEESIEGD
jgi:ABC-type transport system involved in multi-copper enzyme maturation permease subunit